MSRGLGRTQKALLARLDLEGLAVLGGPERVSVLRAAKGLAAKKLCRIVRVWNDEHRIVAIAVRPESKAKSVEKIPATVVTNNLGQVLRPKHKWYWEGSLRELGQSNKCSEKTIRNYLSVSRA